MEQSRGEGTQGGSRLASAAEFARNEVSELLPPGPLCDVIGRVLDSAATRAASQASRDYFPLTVHLPLAIHAAAGRPERDALPIAAAGLLVHMGADLLDKVIDEQPIPHGLTTGQALLVGPGLIGVLPQQIIARMQLRPELRLQLIDELCEGIVAMGDGESREQRARNAPYPLVADAIQAATLKSGALLSASARMSAIVASGSPKEVDAVGVLGGVLGVADQIVSDWNDIARADSDDLRTGTRSILVSMFSEASVSTEGTNVHELLAKANNDIEARRALADRIRCGEFSHVLSQLLAACHDNAHEAISTIGTPWRTSELRSLIDDVCV